jgi:hypothetical protein
VGNDARRCPSYFYRHAIAFAVLNPSCAPHGEANHALIFPSRISRLADPRAKWVERSEPGRIRIDGRRPGTARPFPLWRLRSGPYSPSVDQILGRACDDLPPTEYPVAQHLIAGSVPFASQPARIAQAVWLDCHIPRTKFFAGFADLLMHSSGIDAHRAVLPFCGSTRSRKAR